MIPLKFRFFLRRIKFGFFGTPKIEYIIVDLDGTLLSKSTFKRSLELCLNDRGAEMYAQILEKLKTKKLSDSNVMCQSSKLLISNKFNQTQLDRIIKEAEININRNLLDVLLSLSMRGYKIILITRSAKQIADHFSKKYNFFGSAGTIVKFDEQGIMKNTEILVSDVDCKLDGNTFKTKITLANEICEERKVVFDTEKTCLITDSFTDLNLVNNISLFVLMVPLNDRECKPEQKYMLRNKLYDIKINEVNCQILSNKLGKNQKKH